ncbi:hypothetical protein [Epilithonimonas hungarica]|uniref:Tetratricopeptide repeat protein n=1 Tax=Epilithonimonas hungarica TaxID=454006 RepID=A0A1G7FS30_9FLAO|nr:hypothetical protein [Epilithonimonas hungarica]SDE78688.1 hypothetical protein SAMN05421825_0200 [Epilithonimonas hungarica]
MNTRVLELVKNPKIITESDLDILRSESEKMPYAQSIRALYLYGINLYMPEKYKENLSKTAAYTTDKKILYHFVNSEKISKKEALPTSEITEKTIDNQKTNNETKEDAKPAESEIVTEIENTETHSVLNKFDVEKIIETENGENSEFIVVDGEKNRLLYEGEENFLEEKTPEVDPDASQESGQLVLKEEAENIDAQISIDDNRAEESISVQENMEDISIPEETKIEEISTEQESEPEITSGDISFNGIQEFLPNVKFSIPKNHLDYLNPSKKEKSEEKPIEEKPVITSEYKEPLLENISEDDIDDSQISFENTQSFEISEPQKVQETVEDPIQEQKVEESQINFENMQTFEITEKETPEAEIKPEITETKTEVQEPVSEWKPMSFSINIPDALIGKNETEEREIPKIITKVDVAPTPEKIDKVDFQTEIIAGEAQTEEKEIEIPEEERPIFNVSFFGNDVSKIEEKKAIIPIPEKAETKQTPESNVGAFINTWQSWLKIERPETRQEPSKAKEKIIDNFIETNPKISQLKEESNYVVKEKKDDISHLMTETLARLYTEQKLYSKAIKAYEILSEKHPEKKDYFEEKIEEIKDIRKPQ